ncbi:MAG: DUF1841 family protein [Woeseiaceae bacterium]|nr:DUF1841 family protein [Woeseiaceae bacterium]
MFGQDRDELRRMYMEAWRKARANEPLSALEAQIAGVIEDHPEYHDVLTSAGLDADYTPQGGETNPFLHMGLHLALRDQLQTDRPPGIRALHARIARRSDDRHDAEHRMIECLAETLWEAQGRGAPPDEARYLDRLRRIA